MTTKDEALRLITRMRDKIGEDSLSDEGFYDLYTDANDFLIRAENDPPETRPTLLHWDECGETKDGDATVGLPHHVTCPTCREEMLANGFNLEPPARRMPSKKKAKRRHSRSGQVRCEICSPLRCSYAR